MSKECSKRSDCGRNDLVLAGEAASLAGTVSYEANL